MTAVKNRVVGPNPVKTIDIGPAVGGPQIKSLDIVLDPEIKPVGLTAFQNKIFFESIGLPKIRLNIIKDFVSVNIG